MIIELNKVEQEKISACILAQALRFEQEADRLDSLEYLTDAQLALFDKYLQYVDYYLALSRKILGKSEQ